MREKKYRGNKREREREEEEGRIAGMGTVVFHLGYCSPHNSGAYYGCYSFGPRQLRLRCICAATDSRTDICAPIRYCVSLRCNKRCNILSDVASPEPANPVPKSIRVYLRSPIL